MIAFNAPSLVRIGPNAVLQLPELLSLLGKTRPFFVVDPHFRDTEVLARIRAAVGAAGGDNAFFGVVPDPTTGSAEEAVRLAKACFADVIIGMGGGSAIDTAKAVALLSVHDVRLNDLRAPHRVMRAGLPMVAIPTTAGTGSEATQACLITDSETGDKMVCVGEAFMPVAAVVDYTLTLSVPARVTAETGIDAFTHALEAYVGRGANVISDLYAGRALPLIARALPVLADNPSDEQARADMMLGSFLAGTSFTNSGLGLSHAMSVPLGGIFHLTHGFTIGRLLPAVTRFSVGRVPGPYARVSRLLCICADSDDAVAASAFSSWLDRLIETLAFPTLSGRGVDRAAYDAAIPAMARAAPRSGTASNNPAIATVDDIEALFQAIWA